MFHRRAGVVIFLYRFIGLSVYRFVRLSVVGLVDLSVDGVGYVVGRHEPGARQEGPRLSYPSALGGGLRDRKGLAPEMAWGRAEAFSSERPGGGLCDKKGLAPEAAKAPPIAR